MTRVLPLHIEVTEMYVNGGLVYSCDCDKRYNIMLLQSRYLKNTRHH